MSLSARHIYRRCTKMLSAVQSAVQRSHEATSYRFSVRIARHDMTLRNLRIAGCAAGSTSSNATSCTIGCAAKDIFTTTFNQKLSENSNYIRNTRRSAANGILAAARRGSVQTLRGQLYGRALVAESTSKELRTNFENSCVPDAALKFHQSGIVYPQTLK